MSHDADFVRRKDCPFQSIQPNRVPYHVLNHCTNSGVLYSRDNTFPRYSSLIFRDIVLSLRDITFSWIARDFMRHCRLLDKPREDKTKNEITERNSKPLWSFDPFSITLPLRSLVQCWNRNWFCKAWRNCSFQDENCCTVLQMTAQAGVLEF